MAVRINKERIRERRILEAARLAVKADEACAKLEIEVTDWAYSAGNRELLEVEVLDKRSGRKTWYKIRR